MLRSSVAENGVESFDCIPTLTDPYYLSSTRPRHETDNAALRADLNRVERLAMEDACKLSQLSLGQEMGVATCRLWSPAEQ